MKKLLILALALPAACGGSSWGTELTRETPQGTATLYHTDAVAPELAGQVFDAMVASAYNFASDLDEQVDRVDGRLLLRLCNDNEDSINDMIADPAGSGLLSYFNGLAYQVSQAIGGEELDISLCRLSLDDEFYLVTWEAP